MTRDDAIELSNMAGFMLMYTEQDIAKRHGIAYPLLDTDIERLPFGVRGFLATMRKCRNEVTYKVIKMIDDGTKSCAEEESS